MGLAMVTNLPKHLLATNSPPLLFTNRTMSRGASLGELGGVPVATIGEIVRRSDIVFSSVSIHLSFSISAFCVGGSWKVLHS